MRTKKDAWKNNWLFLVFPIFLIGYLIFQVFIISNEMIISFLLYTFYMRIVMQENRLEKSGYE